MRRCLLTAYGYACGAVRFRTCLRVAIYHFSAKMISRSSGRSAVAAAAYRSASALLDEREARTHDFSHKADVVHSEILLSDVPLAQARGVSRGGHEAGAGEEQIALARPRLQGPR